MAKVIGMTAKIRSTALLMFKFFFPVFFGFFGWHRYAREYLFSRHTNTHTNAQTYNLSWCHWYDNCAAFKANLREINYQLMICVSLRFTHCSSPFHFFLPSLAEQLLSTWTSTAFISFTLTFIISINAWFVVVLSLSLPQI